MLVILYVALAVVALATTQRLAIVALATTYRLIGKARRRRRVTRGPLTQVFRLHELRELDAHLDEIAAAELRRMDAAVVSYMAGEVGTRSGHLRPPESRHRAGALRRPPADSGCCQRRHPAATPKPRDRDKLRPAHRAQQLLLSTAA